MSAINTHGMICEFGKHKGTPYTRLPVSYLLWMVNVKHSKQEIAQAELDRRGTVAPDLDLSGHAIDRASLRCLNIWQSTRQKGEGLHAWLARVGREALDAAPPDKDGRCFYMGMKLAFEMDGAWPVLKTVMPHKTKDKS